MRRLLPLLLAGLLAQGCAQHQDGSAAGGGETLLVAQRIHTSDPSRPVAGAMVWDAEGRILDVGSPEDLWASWPDAELMDLGDAVVVPGLIDSHGHLLNYGFSLMSADLVGARDKAEVIARLQAFAADLPEGAWLQGRGWDQNLWPEREFPTAADLDEAFPDRPVWLVRVDGHAGWGNSEALRRAEAVEGARPLAGDWHPEGARIERTDGQASGVFVGGRARALVERAIPEQDEALREQALERALAAAVSMGLRLNQHGLAPERLWGLVAIVVATAYGVGFWFALIRGRKTGWPGKMRQANFHLGLFVCALALLLALPILDFGAISTRDQLARLDSGAVSADEFDYAALRWDFGEPGRRALGRLAESDNAQIAELAQAALAQTQRYYGYPRPVRTADEIDVRIQPDDPELRRMVLNHLRGNPWQCHERCVALDLGSGPTGRRVAIVQTGSYEVVTIGRDGSGVRAPEVAPAVAPIRDDSVVEIREVPARYVFVDGKPVGPPLEALDGAPPPR